MEIMHSIESFVLLHHNLVMPITVHSGFALEGALNLINGGVQTIFIPPISLTLM